MLGEILKNLRKEKGIEAQFVANKINVSKATYSGYENNKSNPNYDILCKLADFFDVTTDYLLGRTEDKDVYVLVGEDVPKELREVGIDEIGILKEFKDSGFTKEEIQEIIEFAKKMKKQP